MEGRFSVRYNANTVNIIIAHAATDVRVTAKPDWAYIVEFLNDSSCLEGFILSCS
jgi:hypothetical protein